VLTIGSLFSGIGGLELGLEWAGLGPVAWQVENDGFCRDVLARHWPDADRSVVDVRRAGAANLAPVDLVCGGFPCTDLSHLGKRRGMDGEQSGLWFEMLRVCKELNPEWIIIENIHHAWRKWVPIVRGDLERIGHPSVPLRVSAAEVGADHIRRRVFVVAHPDRELIRKLSRRWCRPYWEVAPEPLDYRWGTAASRMDRIDDGVPRGVDRRKALGNSVVPQCAEVIGWIVRELIETDQ
jgi:DNA (cytosine-5)-methyltransferase 1